MTYIKSGILPVEMSAIIKSAFSLRSESDYKDFYVISNEDVIRQVEDAVKFVNFISEYIENELS